MANDQSRRVVITGVGLVTAGGLDTSDTWKTVTSGKSAVSAIEGFDVSRYPTRIAAEIKNYEATEYLDKKEIDHTRGAPYHPQTQGKIERYHRTMKNVVKLQNYYTPEALRCELAKFAKYYNNERVHESLKNVTPADVYLGRHHEIQTARQLLKMQTLRRRRCYNQGYQLKEEELIRPSAIRACVY